MKTLSEILTSLDQIITDFDLIVSELPFISPEYFETKHELHKLYWSIVKLKGL